MTRSPSGSAELASWEESGLITKNPGQEEPEWATSWEAVSDRETGDDREVGNLGS